MPTSTERKTRNGPPKRVALLGADSLVGTHVIPALEASQFECVPVVDYKSRAEIRGESQVWDPTDARSVAAAVEGCFAVIVADSWVPTALSVRQARCEAVRRARALTDGVRAAGVIRTVFVSHLATLGDDDECDASSFHLPGSSDNAVVEARWSMEAEIFRAIKEGAEIPIIIPGLVIGPRDERADATLVVELMRGRWPALPDGRIPIVDARDLARSIVQAVTAGRSGRRYPVVAGEVDVAGFLDALGRVVELERPRVVSRQMPGGAARLLQAVFSAAGRTIAIESTLAHIRSGRVNDSKARGELSFVARPVRKTLEDAAIWYRDAFGWTG